MTEMSKGRKREGRVGEAEDEERKRNKEEKKERCREGKRKIDKDTVK